MVVLGKERRLENMFTMTSKLSQRARYFEQLKAKIEKLRKLKEKLTTS